MQEKTLSQYEEAQQYNNGLNILSSQLITEYMIKLINYCIHGQIK